MLQLSPQELEEIVDAMEDPLQRSKAGMFLFESGGYANKDSFSKYAESYLQIMIQGGEYVASEYKDNSFREHVCDVLPKMPKEKAKELAKMFVDKRINDFREQNPINPVRVYNLKTLIKNYDLTSPTYELCILANEFIDPDVFDKIEVPEEMEFWQKYGILCKMRIRMELLKE